MNIPIRRSDGLSDNAKSIVVGALERLHLVRPPQAPMIPSAPQKLAMVNNTFVRFDEALVSSGRFTPVGWGGLYKEANSDADYGRIWVKKTFTDPKTGKSEEWLMVYTTDEDEIVRQLASTEKRQMFKEATIKNAVFVDKELNAFKTFVVASAQQHIHLSPSMLTLLTSAKSMVEIEQVLTKCGFEDTTVAYYYKDFKTAAQPSPKNIPIAPGIKSKNLTMDETGGQGTAKVTIEFTDVDKGLKFYQEQAAGGGEAAPPKPEEGTPPAEGEEEGTTEKPAGPPAQQGGPKPPALPGGGAPMAPMTGLKSTVRLISRAGAQIVTVIKQLGIEGFDPGAAGYRFPEGKDISALREKALAYVRQYWRADSTSMESEAIPAIQAATTEEELKNAVDSALGGNAWQDVITSVSSQQKAFYSFVNEQGQQIILPWARDLKQGDQFIRPDTGDTVRLAGYQVINYFPVDAVIGALVAEGKELPPAFLEQQKKMKEKSKGKDKGSDDKKDSKDEKKDTDKGEKKDEKKGKPDFLKKKEDKKESSQHVANMIPSGSRVTSPTGEQGITQADSRPGIDKRVAVLWDGQQQAAFADPTTLTAAASLQKVAYGPFEQGDEVTDLEGNYGTIVGPGHEQDYYVDFGPLGRQEASEGELTWAGGERGGVGGAPPYGSPGLDADAITGPSELPADYGIHSGEELPDTTESVGKPRGRATFHSPGGSYTTDDPEHAMDLLKRPRASVDDLVDVLVHEAKSPPGRKHEVEELKEKGMPAGEAFGIAWKQHNKEKGKKPKKSSLSLVAVDVSDDIPPMSWTNDESKNEPAGAGQPLPPNQQLQQGQDTGQNNVLYDSNKAQGPQFQTTINPKDKSVTVKFIDDPTENALKQVVQGPQQQLPGGPQQQQQPAPPPGQQPGGMGTQPQQQAQFADTTSPVEF